MADVRTMRDGTSIERRYLHFLVEVGEILGESLDYTSTLQRVCEAAVRTVADAATMYLFEDGKLEVVGAAHFLDERSSDFRDNIVALIRDLTGPRRRIEEVIRGGRGFLVEYVDDDSIDSIASGNDHARFMRDLGVRSFVIVPLVSQTRGVLGALGLVCVEESGWRYDQEAMILAEDLGRRCGTAIAKAKLHATALDVSARFQIAALPRSLPRVDGITLDAIYEPASSDMLVGGDWYDAFTLSDGRLGISIGDVSGHGLQAAAFMGSLRDALRVALYLDADMMRALQVADHLMREENADGMYATANLGIVDAQRRRLTSVAAGHPGPLYWSPRTQTVEDPFLERGLPLGFRDLGESASPQKTIDLHPGSFIAFFTDGLIEGERDIGKGEAKLAEAIKRADVREALHPAEALRRAVAPDRHADDLAIMTLRVDA